MLLDVAIYVHSVLENKIRHFTVNIEPVDDKIDLAMVQSTVAKELQTVNDAYKTWQNGREMFARQFRVKYQTEHGIMPNVDIVRNAITEYDAKHECPGEHVHQQYDVIAWSQIEIKS